MNLYGDQATCQECYSQMKMDPNSGLWVCPVCGEIMDDSDFDPWEDSEIPACCETCGGPYPECEESCSLIDD